MDVNFTFITKALRNHPEKLLLLGCGILITILFKLGINQWLSCLTPMGLYILYLISRYLDGKNKVSLKELDIKRLETQAKLAQQKRRKRRKP
ncbi:hypothetical protein D1224_09380 [Henriciella barbarensis]|uniref:Uncharacterized protein n=1 Tax=Henriciella barbarensis TaxID=86342 RepID=A0A399R3J2_9PROT|nr:hypothetical protein [Henriciella barbarensis]RIJ24427.1 hypothetical protein D1224_09380 [Henriciella barbarensis]